MVTLGEGGCRGQGWNKNSWPVFSGRRTLVQCAEDCIAKSCTAFHVLKEEDGKFECVLFGHKDILPVKSLGGECKALSDKEPAETGTDDEDDEEEEVEVTGPVHMALLGKGRCRGEGWTSKKWPVIKGILKAKACAEACARRKGCTAFDLSEEQEDRTFECGLYGHKKIQPASGVPGNCYVLSEKPGVLPGEIGAAAIEEEEQEVEEEIPVTGDVDYHQLGKGRCRGEGWASKKWPVIKGSLTPKDCAVACAKKKGCTGFDIGTSADGPEECGLYGHKNVVPAYGVPGDCYKLGKSTEPEDEEEEEEDVEIDDGGMFKNAEKLF